jgi:hypothetical protein
MIKKLLNIALVSFSVVVIGYAAAATLYPFDFTFTGKWQPAEDPLLIEPNGFQEIQNLRRDGVRLKGVSGHTKINTAKWHSTDTTPRNGFHYKKNSPAETHVLIYSETSTEGAHGAIHYSDRAIATTGNFTDTLYTNSNTTGMDAARFSDAPQEDLIVNVDEKTLVWGGDETFILSFITSDTSTSLSSPKDYSDQVTNISSDSDQVAIIGGGDDAETKLLLHSDGLDTSTTFTDNGETGHTVNTNGNAQLTTDAKKFGTASGTFDGTGDHLDIANHADWDVILETNFTIDLWVKHTDHASTEAYITHYADTNSYWSLYHVNGSGISFKVRVGGSDDVETPAGGEITDTNWHHIAIVKVGSEYAVYKDGSQVSYKSDADTGNFTGSLYIATRDATNWDFEGELDEIRVYHGNYFGASPQSDNSDLITVPPKPYGTASNHFFIGSPKQLHGVKLYIADGNGDTAATLTAAEWQGSSWVGLTIVDDTSGLESTDSIAWTKSGAGKVKYIQGLSLYWYRFSLSSGNASIYYVTGDAPIQTLKNVWDGAFSDIASFKKYDGSSYVDYTDEVQSEADTDVAILDSLTSSTHYALAGFDQPQQGLKILFPAGKENSTAATTLIVQYWDGDNFVDVTGLSDGTEEGSISFAQTGVISFQPPAPETEFKKAFADENPLYYYKLVFDENLDTETEVYQVLGIPAPGKIKAHKFSLPFQNRLFLFNEIKGVKNKVIYSADNTSYIFNGDDSGELHFGDAKPIVAAAQLYNVFRTTGYYQLIVFKENETWRLFGDGPANWEIQQISANIGTIAPLSVAISDATDVAEGVKRQVIIWATSDGFYMCDGATVTKISGDIDNYFDPNHSDYIAAADQDNILGWYDPSIDSYKATVVTGSTQIELEYSLKYQAWTRLYRENGSGSNPMRVGFKVHDTTGKVYTYGATSEGILYQLESGNLWDTTAIVQYVRTKEMMLDREKPLLTHTFIKYLRTMFEKKTASDDKVAITHYCNGVATTHGSNNQYVPRPFWPSEDIFDTQSAYLGPCLYHSLKYSTTNDSATDGIEMLGTGIYYERKEAIKDVAIPPESLSRITTDGDDRFLASTTTPRYIQ